MEDPQDVLVELARQVTQQGDFVWLFFGSHKLTAISLVEIAKGVIEGEERDGRTFRFLAASLIGVLEGTAYEDSEDGD